VADGKSDTIRTACESTVKTRLLIAGTHSSVGKTTVTIGLLAALRSRGHRPAPFKAGPDYIDPGLHTRAAGRPSRNLDVWLLDDSALSQVFARGTRNADVAVIEGVMGLFDGIGATQQASTAALARTLNCPVVLVIDVAAMSGTAAALVLGCQRMQPGVRLAGVILNRVGSEGHLQATAEAIFNTTRVPVLGSLPADPSLAVPERHLGLVPAAEGGMPADLVDRLGRVVEERFDLQAIWQIAESAAPIRDADDATVTTTAPIVKIAVAQDRAFGFYYQDTIDLISDNGAEIAPFSPLDDAGLPPDTDGVYIGGGFPELYATDLSRNGSMRQSLQTHAQAGRPIYAECGGLMALGQSLSTFDGGVLPMFGLLPVGSRMQRESLTIGYREVEALRATPLMPSGGRVRGHEFHWSLADPPPPELAAYRLTHDGSLEGYCAGATLGSYVHLNFAGAPELAQRFVGACAARRIR
jgi:cobyrinic acid a,c-diamide synthase